MTVTLLTDQHLEFLSLKGGCTCSYEHTLVKMPHCLKSHVAAQIWRLVLCKCISHDFWSDATVTDMATVSGIPVSQMPYRGSYMSAHVLLNLLNELGKRDKMRGWPSILSLFRNEFNKFNNTRARM